MNECNSENQPVTLSERSLSHPEMRISRGAIIRSARTSVGQRSLNGILQARAHDFRKGDLVVSFKEADTCHVQTPATPPGPGSRCFGGELKPSVWRRRAATWPGGEWRLRQVGIARRGPGAANPLPSCSVNTNSAFRLKKNGLVAHGSSRPPPGERK